MNNNSVGSNMNLLFVGHAIALAVSILALLGVSGGLWSLVNLASLIIVLVALDRLKIQHPGYGKAFGYEIIHIVFSMISGILLVVLVLMPLLSWLLWPVAFLVTVGSSVLSYLVVRYTCLPTVDLVKSTGDMETVALGARVDQIYLICTAVSVVCTILSVIPLLGGIFKLLGKLASLASVAGLTLMVCFLYRAKLRLS